LLALYLQNSPDLRLEDFGATSWLPSLIGIAIVRALGPLVTALICAGKVGSGIGAELGSMKVTEQIEAMEVSAINPFKYLVVTRVLATTITIPNTGIVLQFFRITGFIYQRTCTGNKQSAHLLSKRLFIHQLSRHIRIAVAKSIAYGFTIGIVGSYKGFNATQGTRGVGKAANQAVVLSMFLIFIEELFFVQICQLDSIFLKIWKRHKNIPS
jgi:phospholipid/cholesterol/gamma-HCH transport system permease protein